MRFLQKFSVMSGGKMVKELPSKVDFDLTVPQISMQPSVFLSIGSGNVAFTLKSSVV